MIKIPYVHEYARITLGQILWRPAVRRRYINGLLRFGGFTLAA